MDSLIWKTFILVLVYTFSETHGFTLKCPHSSQRAPRIFYECNGNSVLYTCLYDSRKKDYTEICSTENDFVRSGFKYVISGTFRNVRCSAGRYQPIRFWSNKDTECLLSKTKCNDLGQTMHENESTENDATCRCDYTKGFSYVSQPRNQCFCIPSEEDCSCYMKQCPANSILSPDYDCIPMHVMHEKFFCHRINNSVMNETEYGIDTVFVNNNQQQHLKKPGTLSWSVIPLISVHVVTAINVLVLIMTVLILYISYRKIASVITGKDPHRESQTKETFREEQFSSSVSSSYQLDRSHCGDTVNKENLDNATNLLTNGAEDDINADFRKLDVGCNIRKTGNKDSGLCKLDNKTAIVIIGEDHHLDSSTNGMCQKERFATLDSGNIQIYRGGVTIPAENKDTMTTKKKNEADIQEYNIPENTYTDSEKNTTELDHYIINAYPHGGKLEEYDSDCSQTTDESEIEARSINSKNQSKKREPTQLMSACLSGKIESVRSLIENGAKIHTVDHNARSAIMYACAKGHEAIVKLLIKSGADIHFADSEGHTPFYLSCVGGNIDLVKYLKDQGCDVLKSNNSEKTSLMAACGHGYWSIVELLAESGSDIHIVDNEGRTPFYWSCVGGNNDIVNFLIDEGCNIHQPSNNGKTPLMEACGKGHISVVNNLIEKGVDINTKDKKGKTPFYWSCVGGKIEIVQLLLRKGSRADLPNTNGENPLMAACSHSHLDIVKLIVERGADINSTDNDGQTPLHWSCTVDNTEIASFLIKKRSSVDKPNNNRETSLMVACGCGFLSLVELLIENGSDINITDDKGQTPFYWSCVGGNIDVVNLLIDKGCDEHRPNNEGRTPLMEATDQEHKSVVKLLTAREAYNNERITELNEINVEFPWLQTSSRLRGMLAKGTFRSYDNNLCLAGPCMAGKSTLASVLIDDEIPLQYKSTDGLVIFFGRNGIDLENKTMVPLKIGERGHSVVDRFLRGNPTLEIEVSDVSRTETFLSHEQSPILGHAASESPDEEAMKNEYTLPESLLHAHTSKLSTNKNTEVNRSIHQTQRGKITPIDEMSKPEYYTIHDDILNEVRTGRYKISIAPSDLIDFGGQRSYDMTHQLFIHHSGSFVLMFDGHVGLDTPLKEYKNRKITASSTLKHWVDSILTYAEDTEDIMPKILFAATHKDKCDQANIITLKKSFIQRIQQMFSSYDKKGHMVLDIVYFIDARDCNDPEIKDMTDKIVDFAMQQSTWGKERPMIWVPLEIQISKMKSKNINLIDKKQLENVNKLNKDLALDEDQLEYFLLVHHSLGKLIYYNLPGLDKFIVIHPPALVNILRAFITDDIFWPKAKNLLTVLKTLRKSGKIYKKDLLLLWQQHECKQYIKDDETNNFLVSLFVHLDILVVPKGINRSPSAADIYLVPCMVTTDCPVDFVNFRGIRDTTICLIYSLSMQAIPTSLAYKIIGGAAGIWPFKEDKDGKPCLYQNAAILLAGDDNELRVQLKDNSIMVYLSNKESMHYISPDIAASIQECLTQTLESSLLFYYSSFGKKKKQADVQKLFELSGGLICNNTVCHIALSEAKTLDGCWTCMHGREHNRKYMLSWIFNKTQKTCSTDCRGPDETILHQVPNDKHLMRLTSEIDIQLFEKVLRQLDDTNNIIKEWRRFEYQFSSTHNPLGIMFMALHFWREKKSSDLQKPSLFDIYRALQTTKVSKHSICQIFREDTTLLDIADSLHDIPGDDLLEELSQRIGNSAIQLGIELGLSFNEVQKTMVEYSRNVFDQINDILRKWKAKSSVNTVYSLVVALKRVAPSSANYLREKYVQ